MKPRGSDSESDIDARKQRHDERQRESERRMQALRDAAER